jgi:hypothetical protein
MKCYSSMVRFILPVLNTSFICIMVLRVTDLHLDCNWGDHCADVTASLGVVSQRTPHGLKLSEFQMALEKYKMAAEQRSMSS